MATRLGSDVLAGETPPLLVPAGTWQGARLLPGGARSSRGRAARGFALLGCTLSPAWEERGFELGRREQLQREFPQETERIAALTR